MTTSPSPPSTPASSSPGYASIFKSSDGTWYGFPKDGNTIGLAYNTDLVTTAPKTLDDLTPWATDIKGKAGSKAPLCLNPGLDRGLTFIYAQGGSLLSADGKTADHRHRLPPRRPSSGTWTCSRTASA